jgi:hypothetical protein
MIYNLCLDEKFDSTGLVHEISDNYLKMKDTVIGIIIRSIWQGYSIKWVDLGGDLLLNFWNYL